MALRTIGWAGAIVCALGFNLMVFRDMVAPPADASIEVGQVEAVFTEPNPAEVHLLAATMWGEARSEGEHGMRAVAHVMVNRVGPRFGDSLETVILAPWQFSVWNNGDPNRPLVRNPERYAKSKIDQATWAAAQRIAYEVLSGRSVDPTNGALFYHTSAIRPSWSRHGVGKQTIGAHIFYRDVPNQAARVRTISSEGARAARDAADAAPQRVRRSGPRAGRVNGVIQTAPRQEDPPPPQTVIDTSRPLTPPELAAAIADI
ncbi:MAG: cell wall hydrolase [Hyphomonadaceae bacterium]